MKKILPLVEIPGVKRARARALWNAGFRSVRTIANAKVILIINFINNNFIVLCYIIFLLNFIIF